MLRSIAFLALLSPYMVLMSLFSLTIGFVLPVPQRMKVAVCTERVISFLLRWCCSISVSVQGAEHLKAVRALNAKGQGVVVISNHQSPWETFYLQSLFYPLKTVLKKELLRIPLFGWSLALLKPVVLDRSKKTASASLVIRQGLTYLSQGYNLLLFPQGTRVGPGEPIRFSRSAVKLAIDSGSPIICIAHNAGVYWSARSFVMQPGVIHLTISEPIDTKTNSDSRQLNAETAQWVGTHIHE